MKIATAEFTAVAEEERSGYGSLSTPSGNLPLKAMGVEAEVTGLLGKTSLRQTFVNTTDEHLEATYIFPLPDRAAVTRFRLEVGERVIEGNIKERGEARRAYDAAISAGHRAAIAEEERPDVFTIRVGNLPPGEEVSVWLDLAGPLELSSGAATYRFPLVVAPRYVPGRTLDGEQVGDGVTPDTDQVPDASRISPPTLLSGHPNPVALSLSLRFDPGGVEANEPRCSMPVRSEGSGLFTLDPGQRLDQDFVFRFGFLAADLQTSLVLEPDEGAESGTFMLAVVPPDQRGSTAPRDVAFVLDRSGSMGGWKMAAARRACADLVDSLTDADRFVVLAFDTRIETPFGGGGVRLDQSDFALKRDAVLVPATSRNRAKAALWLCGVDARGGTEIAAPLLAGMAALAAAPDADALQPEFTAPAEGARERTLVLITDGQVGNEDGVLRAVSGKQVDVGATILTLGIDRAVNAGFLRRLADAGGGRCELVEGEERLDEVLDGFARQIGRPFLEDVRFSGSVLEVEADSVVPAAPRHLFPGVPLLVTGRYERANLEETLCIPGVVPSISPRVSEGKAIAPSWARARVRDLEDRWARSDRYGSGRADLAKLVVAHSLKHKVLCRFTAFVAVDSSEVVNEGGEQHKVVQPVEAPSGWASLGAGGQMLAGRTLCSTQGMGGVRGMSGGGAMRCVPIPAVSGPGPEVYTSLSSVESLTSGGPVGNYGTAPPRGVEPSFSGFAPGFDPMARRTRSRKRGPTGPQGPAGPKGPQGPQGMKGQTGKPYSEAHVVKARKLIELVLAWKDGDDGKSLASWLAELVALLRDRIGMDRASMEQLERFAAEGRHHGALIALLEQFRGKIDELVAADPSRRDGAFWARP